VVFRKPRPGDHPCAAVYGAKYNNRPDMAGKPCDYPANEGEEFCARHKLWPIPDEKRCTAHLSKNHKTDPGGRCPLPARAGQKVCGMHGGKAPRALKAAKDRIVEEKARQLVATYGRKIETTATEALLEEVQWTAGHVAWLRERVQEVEGGAAASDGENPLVWGKTRRKTGGEDWGETEEAAPNIWLKLYQQERNHLVKVCSEAIKAGIEERRVRLAEQQGALVAQAIRAILDDLHLTPDQTARIPEIVPRHLRALAS
jgi:hypothetical protein